VNLAARETTAVVVYYRTPVALATCVAALAAQGLPADQIVVVDNAAAEDGRYAPPLPNQGCRWVRSETNCGFGAACNLGALGRRRPFLLFLNADVNLMTGGLEALVRRARSDPTVGVVGPRIYDAVGEIELNARRFPRLRTGLLGRASRLTRVLRKLGVVPGDLAGATQGAVRVDWVSGACMLVRREAFLAVGGFDEQYWMYWEDADLCKRLADQGWSTWFESAAVARHATGSSGTSERTLRAFHASAGRYYAQHSANTRLSATLGQFALTLRLLTILWRHDQPQDRSHGSN
jgi:N-acetylglucosaminyl-diphospho-decaprenol L-rhamnosyltransferase